MPNNKGAMLWKVNVLSFILFMVLTVTGFLNWLLLPGGHRGEGVFRHFLRETHEWTALLFIIAVVIHLILHWTYIKANLKKHGLNLGLKK